MNRIATTPKAANRPIEVPKKPSLDKMGATYDRIVRDSATRPADFVKNWNVPAGGE
ncbi:MAG: hypothetical protein HY720_32530 [Planctomycetes bacterium]|nr:hypothetical protein [Planctomycetota bacterium]